MKLTTITILKMLPLAASFAVDGVILIDQNRALAGGVTPGDTPGFPIVISLPGSYRLSGNLAFTPPAHPDFASSIAISITADDVTLDLNGFTVRLAACDGCSSTGIAVSGSDVEVRNGVIRGFNFIGIDGQRGLLKVDGVRLTASQVGIRIGSSGEVRNCVIEGGAIGVLVEGAARVRDSLLVGNAFGLNFKGRAGSYSGNTLANSTDIFGQGANLGQNSCNGLLCP